MVRRLLPDDGRGVETALDELYTDLDFPPPPPHRPHTYLDMVASADGAATAAGRTELLGGEADRVAFSRLREWCDAILVGASTVRVEGYGPPRPREASQQRRRARGLDAVPRLVVVTASAALDPSARLFSDPEQRPLLLVPGDVEAARIAVLTAVADVVEVGRGWVDLRAAMGALRERGVERLLCEGGPSLNAQLLREGLVDEIFLTIAPQLVGASRHRIVQGPLPDPPPLELSELREHDGELLLRYRVGGAR